MSIATPRCGLCRFWPRGPYAEINDLPDNGLAGSDRSDCRRRAPVCADERQVFWPMTLAGDWCGEFEPRSPPPPRPAEESAAGPAMWAKSVGELEISQRVHTVLRHAKITTLGQIARQTRPGFSRLYGAGKVTMAEVDACLRDHGIWWEPRRITPPDSARWVVANPTAMGDEPIYTASPQPLEEGGK